MPSGKHRSKEDTWREDELKQAIQGSGEKSHSKSDRRREDRPKERSGRRDEETRERRSDRRDKENDDRRRDGRKDAVNGRSERQKQRDKASTDKERERVREKDQDGDRDKDRERRRDRDRERERERERERKNQKDGSKERREKDESKEARREKDRSEERRRDRDRDKNGERRRDKDRDEERRREHREREGHNSHRDDRKRDEDRRERRHKDDKRHETRDKERDPRLKPEEDGSQERRHKEKSKEQTGERSDELRRRSDDKRERPRESKDKKERDRDRPQASDGRRKRSDKDGKETSDKDSKGKRGVESRDDKVKKREKEMLESLKREEEMKSRTGDKNARYRAATLEEADAIDEEENKSNKSNTRVNRVPSTTNADEINEEDNAYDYEDDFEDYEEDFEDDETSELHPPKKQEMNELLRAIHAENEDVRTFSREGTKSISRSSDDDSREVKSVRPSTGRGRINFVAAKQKQISEKVASRTKKRGQELMHLIELDVVSFDIFDLPPLNEYELYIKNFGRTDTKQAYVQCNDDNVDRETQCEEIDMCSKWVQYPPEGFISCGGEGDGTNEEEYTRVTENTSIDSVHFASFLQRASQVCLVLLEEAAAVEASTKFKDKKDMACSDGYIQLDTKQPYLEGRKIEAIHISPVKTHLVLAAYGPVLDHRKTSNKVNEMLYNKSVVCLWNINEPSKPQKILICESVPRCCCLSPLKATLAFAGLDDGSLVAWDLREPASLHQMADNMIVRSPTFSTAGVMSEENHHSPVRSVLPVLMPGDSAKASIIGGSTSQEDMLGLSFQLASLEENAVINIWVVVELEKADIAGSEYDFGLAPGGKIKIIKSASLALESPFRDLRKKTSLQTLTMQFLPQDPNHIYVGTDGGYVLHSVRYGARSPPKAYKTEIDCVVDVTSIAVSPWSLPCILVGCRDGTLRLYNLQNDTPLMTWPHSTNGSAVVCLQWSRSRPSVVYVLDARSRLYIWDLLEKDDKPVAVETFKHSRVVEFDLSSDYSATGVGMAGRQAELILGYESGVVEVHRINRRFSTTSADELDRFASFLDGAF